MTTLRIMSVVGARPNFMKIAPFVRAVDRTNAASANGASRNGASGSNSALTIEHCLVHTGQHYDDNMSAAFFAALHIPQPDIDLGVGSGSHAEQVGRTMMAFEGAVRDWRPDWVVVVGDVNATCACSITAKKEWLRLAHIEAGLRSRDAHMPEEINRIVTDRLADLLLTPDAFADDNLRKEGVPETAIRRVGNIMIDTLEQQRAQAEALTLNDIVRANLLPDQTTAWDDAREGERPYAAVTLHRPYNVDDADALGSLVQFLSEELSPKIPLIWPVHPRARIRMEVAGLWERVLAAPNIILLAPVNYNEMLRLNMGAKLLLTDSGGLQEEACVLGTPCLTLRENTERPITLETHGGVCRLVGHDVDRLREATRDMLDREEAPTVPRYGMGIPPRESWTPL